MTPVSPPYDLQGEVSAEPKSRKKAAHQKVRPPFAPFLDINSITLEKVWS